MPPTRKAGVELERHRMSWVLRTVNSFEDLGFEVDRGSLVYEPCDCGVYLFFKYRPGTELIPVYGV